MPLAAFEAFSRADGSVPPLARLLVVVSSVVEVVLVVIGRPPWSLLDNVPAADGVTLLRRLLPPLQAHHTTRDEACLVERASTLRGPDGLAGLSPISSRS
jgi:hypothetical protein